MLCMEFRDTRTLYTIRPAPFAELAHIQVYAWLALCDPGLAAEGCFTSLRCYVQMHNKVLFGFAAIDQSVERAAARAGAKWGSAGGFWGLA